MIFAKDCDRRSIAPTVFDPDVVRLMADEQGTDKCAVLNCKNFLDGGYLCPEHFHLEVRLCDEVFLKGGMRPAAHCAGELLVQPDPAPMILDISGRTDFGQSKIADEQIREMNNAVMDLIMTKDGDVNVQDVQLIYPIFSYQKAQQLIDLFHRIKTAYRNSRTLSEIIAKSRDKDNRISDGLIKAFVNRYMDYVEFEDAKALVKRIYPHRPALGAEVGEILVRLQLTDKTISRKMLLKALLEIYPPQRG